MAGERPKAPHKNELPACIWMQAGVVKQKRCATDYACSDCRFDKRLRRVAEENRRLSSRGEARSTARRRIVYWSDALLALPAHRRPCLHSMKQRIGFRNCTNAYVCGSCEFDQYFQDQFAVHAVIQPVAVQSIQGVQFPQGYYLHKGHGWVRMESGGEVRIGLDAFASRLLGRLDTVKLPLMGKPLKRDQGAMGLGRQDWSTDLLAPVSGVVTAANAAVQERPDLIQEDPYGEGWLLMAYADDLRGDLKTLLMGSEASEHFSSEIEALHATIETELGPLAADGGQLVGDIFSHLPRACWDKVAQQFLRPKPS